MRQLLAYGIALGQQGRQMDGELLLQEAEVRFPCQFMPLCLVDVLFRHAAARRGTQKRAGCVPIIAVM